MTATTICATDPALMEACRISASSKESLLVEAISRGTGCGADKTACPAIPADVVMGSIGMGCRCGPWTDEQSDIEAGDIPSFRLCASPVRSAKSGKSQQTRATSELGHRRRETP